jgi:hypothetical protein
VSTKEFELFPSGRASLLFVAVHAARKFAGIQEKLRSSNFRRSKNRIDDDPPKNAPLRELSIAYGGWESSNLFRPFGE